MLLRLLCAVLMMGMMAGPARAATYFDENFETTLTGNGWSTDSCVFMGYTSPMPASGCNPFITSEIAHAGSKSLRADYTGNPPSRSGCPNSPTIECGVTAYRTFIPTVDHWKRFWNRTASGFTYASITTKKVYDYATDSIPSFSWGHAFGSRDFLVAGQGIPNQTCPSGNNGATCTFPPNMASVPLNNDQWYCIETHLNLGTAGGSDGVIEIFINGVQTTGYYNQRFLEAGQPDSINQTKIYAQSGSGVMYYDDFAVGNSRIGCGSTPPPPSDTVAPSPVTGLAGSVSASTASLSWTNGTDATGVTGQNVRRCTGAACSPTTTLVTLTGTNTSYVDRTLAAGTTYGYSVNDFDAAGNQGVHSSTVYVTAPSTYRTTTFSDTYTVPDAANAGTNYTHGSGAYTPCRVVSQQLVPTTLNTECFETYTGTVANDQWAQAEVAAFTGAQTHESGMLIRFTAGALPNGYVCYASSAANTTQFAKYTAGVFALIAGSSTIPAWQPGDQIRCEMEGTAYRIYHTRAGVETLALSGTDAIYASGNTGSYAYVATGGTLTDSQTDNLITGELTVVAPTPPAIATVDATATQATVTWGSPAPTTIRVFWEFGALVTTLSEYVSGVYTFPNELKATLTNFVCYIARDGQGVEVTGAQICDSVPVAIDTAPPVISNGLPNATLPVDTTSALISVTLDKNGSCRWGTTDPAETEAGYGALANAMTTASFTASGTMTGLTNNTTRNVYVRCAYTDVTGTLRPNLTSTVIVVAVAAATTDTTPPGTTTNLTANVLSQSQVALSWTAASGGAGAGGAIAYVGKTDCASTVSVSTVNCSVTVPACTDCLMVMATQVRDAAATVDAITSATFNGSESLTKIRHDERTGSPSWRTELWYRLAPTETTANLVVNWDGPPDEAIGVTVILLSGVNQSSPVDAQTGSSGTGATASASITTVAADAWIVDSAIGRDDAGLTVGAGQTARTDRILQSGSVNEGAGVSTVNGKASPGAETMDWTQGANDWVLSTASFAPAGASDVAGYRVFMSVGSGSTDYNLVGTPVTTTNTVVNLTSATVHNFVVKAYDTSGNIAASYSSAATVTTASPTDIVPPSTMTNLRTDGVYKNSVVLTWDQGTDDRGSVTTIIEQSAAGCAAFSTAAAQVATSKLIVTLSPSTSYCFRGKFSDGTNASTSWSNTLEVTTGSNGLPQPRQPVSATIPRTRRN